MKNKISALKLLFASLAAAAALTLTGCVNSGPGGEALLTEPSEETFFSETEALPQTSAPALTGTAAEEETNAPTQAGEGVPEETNASSATGEGVSEETNAPSATGEGVPEETNASTTTGESAPKETAAPEPPATEAETEKTEPEETTQTSASERTETAPPPTKAQEPQITEGETEKLSVEKEGSYTTPEDVAEYIHTFGTLPKNFITKSEAKALGWDSSKGNLWDVAEGKSIGGDYFGNYEGLLPKADGRKYTECDVNYGGGYRGGERIIFSNDGLIFYTDDHYKTFTQLY